MKANKPLFVTKFLYMILILLSCFQLHVVDIHSGLDDSWVYAINLFFHEGKLWGRNIIFTYGPLGMVFRTIPMGSNVPAALSFWLILDVFMCVLLAYILFSKRMERINSRPQNIIASLIMFYVGACFLKGFDITGEHVLIYLVMMLLSVCWYIDNMKFFIAAAILTVLSMLLKFSAAVTNFLSLSVFVFVCAMSGKSWRKYFAVLCCVPILFCALFLAYNLDVNELIYYIRGSYEISSGYNSAMSYEWPNLAIVYFLFTGTIFVLLIILCAFTRCRHSFSYAALFAAVMFMAFKHGLAVRHYSIFMPLLFIYLSIYTLFMEHETPIASSTMHFLAASLCIFFCITLVISAQSNEKNASAKVMSLPVKMLQAAGVNSTTLEKIHRNGSLLLSGMITDPITSFCRRVDDAMTHDGHNYDARDIKTPSEFLTIAGDKTMSVYPWDISHVQDFTANYKTMPIFQAYSAYTHWLDELNADFFADDNTAPQYVIFNLNTIDDRFPLIECPAEYLEILRHYGIIKSCTINTETEEYTEYLLSRQSAKSFVIREMLTQEFMRDDVIAIPETDHHCFMKVSMPLSVMGQLAKVFWNIPAVMMDVELSDGSHISKRVLPEVMSNNVLISPLVVDDASFIAVMNGDANTNRVKSIRLSGDGLKYYSSRLNITFSELTY